MKVILLAAGYGTRLKPITNSTPKCLVKIQGKPLLEYWLDLLAKAGTFDILINTHYLATQVQSYIENVTHPHSIRLSYEKELLGTAGTLRAANEFLGNEPVMLIHADNLSKFSVADFIAAHESKPQRCDMTMMLYNTQYPESSGIVELDDEKVVIAFHEKKKKAPGTLANGAVYILDPVIVQELMKRPNISDFSTQVIPNGMGKIFTFFNDVYHRDIGTPESLAAAESEYVSHTAKGTIA
jgi:mannose-1-phosphate guanylyltransferase